MADFSRRRILRGILNGGAVTVGLPLLNCFLNGNGDALAGGTPIPVRFGMWFWGCGITKELFVPRKTGAGFDLPEEIAGLAPIKQHINLLSNFEAFRDGTGNICHYTGWVAARTGIAPASKAIPAATYDVTIANQIGSTRRFKILHANAANEVRLSFSYENANTPVPPEVSPITFYTRLFGPDFQDPNAPAFKPNPRVMARRSVLSGVTGEIKDMSQRLGAEDRARLDQYFTGLRHLEQQFDQQLTKPEPIAACHATAAVAEEPKLGYDVDLVRARHKMLTDLMAMAVACDQTRVFSMAYTGDAPLTIKAGYDKPHHVSTHEEPVDVKLGYQPMASWFTRRSMEGWVDFVQAFADIKEGDGTVLDNTLIVANTESGLARVHSLDGIVQFTAGKAGGKVKTGLHIDGKGASVTRLSYTAMRVMGLEVPTFGTNSNMSADPIGEILV